MQFELCLFSLHLFMWGSSDVCVYLSFPRSLRLIIVLLNTGDKLCSNWNHRFYSFKLQQWINKTIIVDKRWSKTRGLTKFSNGSTQSDTGTSDTQKGEKVDRKTSRLWWIWRDYLHFSCSIKITKFCRGTLNKHTNQSSKRKHCEGTK